jgi:CheY-like chemotaxis protein
VIDLNEIVRRAQSMLRRLIGEDVALHVLLEERPCFVHADPDQLGQVLINLVVNSRDAMPRGGTLTITTGLREQPDPDRSEVVLLVRDTGRGMTSEVKARIFEPFFTTKGPGMGTGLGLAVVHGIVEQSKGHIDVESQPERGTVFCIHLPCDRGTWTKQPDLTPPAQRTHGSETVLLVEDDAAVRLLLQRSLEAIGFRVLAAEDGNEAIHCVLEHGDEIELLVTDVVMPAMSGRELTDCVHRLQPGLPVLYTSGYTDDTVLRHGVSEGEVNLLRKPFTPDVLARKLRQVLDAHALSVAAQDLQSHVG